MQLDFAPLFSGSSGNAIYIRMGETRMLVDAGLSGRRMECEMAKLAVDPASLDALLITHEHSDHIAGAGVMARRYNLPVYATEGTWRAIGAKIGKIAPPLRRVIEPGQDFYIGAVNVMPFAIPHDAAQPVGYTFESGGMKTAVATDLGHLSARWLDPLYDCDLLLLESNHDVDMLKAGPYPYDLKRRILGARGHLSNEDAALAAVELFNHGVKHIILGHLSGENNFPELAWQTVASVLEMHEIYPGEDIGLDVARRDSLSGMYCLRPQQASVECVKQGEPVRLSGALLRPAKA